MIPVMLTVLWPKLSNAAVMGGSIGGTLVAIMAWLIVCRFKYGEINVNNLISNFSSLAGNMTSLYSGGLIALVITLIKPDNYDFKGTRNSEESLYIEFIRMLTNEKSGLSARFIMKVISCEQTTILWSWPTKKRAPRPRPLTKSRQFVLKITLRLRCTPGLQT